MTKTSVTACRWVCDICGKGYEDRQESIECEGKHAEANPKIS